MAVIIPARGGSKGILNKNILDFCGRPLLAWSILQSLAAKSVDQVFVSSDSPAILEISEQNGARGIVRPAALANDTASSEDALLHALAWIERDSKLPDWIAFLQATSPLREPGDIDGSISAAESGGFDSLFSMSVLHDCTIWHRVGEELRGLTFDPWKRGRRQDRAPLFLENGSIYLFRPEVLRRANNRFGKRIGMFEMEAWKAHEIDDLAGMELCEYYFRKRRLDQGLTTGERV